MIFGLLRKSIQTFLIGFTYLNITTPTQAQKNKEFENPILAGCYPDPSIVRVGDDFYMANSSFEYFPGIPISHSKDLVNWENIGFAINRKSQLQYDGICPSCGVWAPSIRYNNGIFYLTITWTDWRMKVGFKNYLLTATNPAGPWSDPIVITDSIWGIDPAIFFDDDGKSYWLMNHPPDKPSHNGAGAIMIQQIDLKQNKLIGDKKIICKGAMLDSKYPEGPKMFKKDEYYYLIIAEGGTGIYHATTIFRSKEIFGEYTNYEGNPILTHRNLGYTSPIINVGHSDLVQTQNNDWWLVCLGSRPLGDKKINIFGRETFLTPMQWDKNEWPIVNPSVGMVRLKEHYPSLDIESKPKSASYNTDFNDSKLANVWSYIRYPNQQFHESKNGKLMIKLLPSNFDSINNIAFLGQRLRFPNGTISTKIDFTTKQNNEESGICLYKDDKNYLLFKIAKQGKSINLLLEEKKKGIKKILVSKAIGSSSLQLKAIQIEDKFSFYYRNDEKGEWSNVLKDWYAGLLSVEESDGFMGSFFGLYASSNGKPSKSIAHFDWFKYIKNE